MSLECRLCEAKKTINEIIYIGDGIFVMFCPICGIHAAISVNHKSEFDIQDKLNIYKIFYVNLKLKGAVDWKMHKNIEHAHAHLKG